jgi:signal transduction histidine kinase
MPKLDHTRLANELHDGVIQEMSAILLHLETYQRRLEMNGDIQAALADLERIKAQSRETLRQLRELVARLRQA